MNFFITLLLFTSTLLHAMEFSQREPDQLDAAFTLSLLPVKHEEQQCLEKAQQESRKRKYDGFKNHKKSLTHNETSVSVLGGKTSDEFSRQGTEPKGLSADSSSIPSIQPHFFLGFPSNLTFTSFYPDPDVKQTQNSVQESNSTEEIDKNEVFDLVLSNEKDSEISFRDRVIARVSQAFTRQADDEEAFDLLLSLSNDLKASPRDRIYARLSQAIMRLHNITQAIDDRQAFDLLLSIEKDPEVLPQCQARGRIYQVIMRLQNHTQVIDDSAAMDLLFQIVKSQVPKEIKLDALTLLRIFIEERH